MSAWLGRTFALCASCALVGSGCAATSQEAAPPQGIGVQAQPQLAFIGAPPIPRPAARAATPSRAATDEALSYADDPKSTPAYRYANLERSACLDELTRRTIPFTALEAARGVLAPVRLTGPVHGVAVHSGIPVSQRATSPIEIFDCRLVLALDDFAALLASHDIVEVIHMSVYRPPPSRRWPAGRVGQRHDGALALDAGIFVRRDGTQLNVEKDFHGRIGARTCGPNTGPWPATPEAIELRRIVCEAADAHLFNVELTPDYNRPHRNHLHLEITPKVSWFLVH
jgi:hypothetical protein